MKDNGFLGKSAVLANIRRWTQKVSGSSTCPSGNAQSVAIDVNTQGCLLAASLLFQEAKDLVIAILALNWRYLAWRLPCYICKRNLPYLVAGTFVAAFWWLGRGKVSSTGTSDAPDGITLADEKFQPRILESLTTHRRLFPSKHSFSYSYLLVGIPIGCPGSDGRVLSWDPPANSSTTWFSVRAEDYLERGHHVDGLAGKLKEYLKLQNIPIDEHPYAYLVTAPRFCRFSFNPVSFWYLYDQDMHLGAMILEVNNTFDERRMYFLKRDTNDPNPSVTRFHSGCKKDFHVSPFNDRDGSYSLTAADPLSESPNRVDNTIVLSSPDGKPKVVARIFSTKAGVDPGTMSTFKTYLFLGRWWWVGFMTNPRILREARTLWVKRLSVFYRPEVQRSSIGRTETLEETKLEPCFRAFLHKMSAIAERDIHYVPAAGTDRGKLVVLQSSSSEKAYAPVIEVKVVTPAFYTELIRGEELLKTFDRFCFSPAKEEAMIFVTDSDMLRKAVESLQTSILARDDPAPGQLESVNRCLRPNTSLLVIFLKVLRDSLLPRAAGRAPSTRATRTCFDSFVQQEFSAVDGTIYGKTCLTVLLADRLALGFTSLLMFYVRALWVITLLAAASHVSGLLHGSRDFGMQDTVVLSLKLIVVHWLRSSLS